MDDQGVCTREGTQMTAALIMIALVAYRPELITHHDCKIWTYDQTLEGACIINHKVVYWEYEVRK